MPTPTPKPGAPSANGGAADLDTTPARRHRLPGIVRIPLKIVAWTLAVVLALLLIVVVAVQVPSVQNRLLAWATPTIEDMLGGADVSIDHIDLDFFDAAQAQGILIRDLRGDTLVYARALGVDVGAFRLFGGAEIFLDELRLDGAVVNAYRLRGDSAFNYQFVLDAFAPDTTAVDTATAAAFGFGLRTVDVTDTRIRLLDEPAASDLNVRAERLLVNIGALDLDTLAVDIDDVSLEGLTGSFVIERLDPIADAAAATAVDTLASGATVVTFPYAGFPVTVGQLALKRVNLAYRDANVGTLATEGLDAGNIGIRDLVASARDFAWDSTRLVLDWEHLAFRERSGLAVRKLAFGLEMTPRNLRVADLEFATDVSRVLATAQLDYPDFAALVAMSPATEVDLVFRESYLAMQDLRLLAPTLREAGINLDANVNLFLDGEIAGTLQRLELRGVRARVGRTTQLVATGVIANPLDAERVAYDLRVRRLTSSYEDLRRLTVGLPIPPELAGFGRFNFSGNVAGTTTTFRGTNLDLRTDGRTGFRGDLALRNLDDPDNLYIDAEGVSLTTSASEIAAFVPDSLGVDVMALGDIDFAGSFAGTATDFVVDGQLDTDAGSIAADLDATFNADYTDGTYRGRVDIDAFDLGAVLRDTTLGTLTLDVEVDGSGLTPEALASSLRGNIESFTYQGYTYRDIAIDGDFDRQVFTGKLSIDDPNLRLDFDGYVNLRDSLPDMRFVAHLDTVALEPLNLYPVPLGLSLAVTANLRGNNADNLVGRLLVDSIYVEDSTRTVYVDSLLLRAGDTTGGRFLLVTSPILNAGIVGDYSTVDLPVLLENYINDFFPVDEYISPVDEPAELAIEPGPQPQRVITDQSFAYRLELRDPTDLVALFDPGLERLDTASFTGTFDSREKALLGELWVPGLRYDGTTVDSIRLDMGGDATAMLLDLRTDGIAVAGQYIDLVAADLRLGDDSLQFDLEAYLERDSLLLGTGLSVHMNDASRYVARVDRELRVAGQVWQVAPGNYIEYWNDYLYVRDLTFRKDGQSIAVSSDDRSQDGDIAPITVRIDDYQLAEITRLVQLDGFELTGVVDGMIGIREPGGDLFYVADLNVQDIVLNGEPVGTLVANASSVDIANDVAVDIRLDGPQNDVAIAGTYGIVDGALDMRARIKAFELRVIDPLALGVLRDSEGLLRADLDITGTVEQPAVDGFVALDGAATTFELLGARLRVDDSRIDVTEDNLAFNTFVVADSAGRTLTVTGDIAHDYFLDYDFDLRVRTDAFRVLNLEPSLQELYYGQAVVAADLAITGTLDVPQVRGNVATRAGTDVAIVPLTVVAGGGDESWVIYADPEELARDTTFELSDVYSANALGIDLSLVVDVDPDATLRVIIDPGTGDALVARGSADMNVAMTPDGDISVTGLYTITEGSYQFTLAGGGLNLKQFDFDIQEGSYMRFVGDPLDSRFDITASNRVQTPTAPLLECNGVTSGVAYERAKQRQPVDVLLSVDGTLEAPEIVMDIEVPEAGGNAFNNDVQRILGAMTQQQVYREVFNLLIFGAFQSCQQRSGGFDPGAVAENAAFNSVSALVGNQLNKLAGDAFGGLFDVNVGLESYEDQYTNSRVNTANVDLSRSLFNDRLTITFGTDVNVSNTAPAAGAATGGFQSSFVLTYQLTESGHYLVRVFRRPDFDIIASGAAQYETGAGVSYQRRFD